MDDLFRSQFRLPQELYEKLKEAAARSGRSLNAEVVFRLNESFTGGGDAAVDLADKLAKPENRAELEALVKVINRLMHEGK
jgi:plasmid stability protein